MGAEVCDGITPCVDDKRLMGNVGDLEIGFSGEEYTERSKGSKNRWGS